MSRGKANSSNRGKKGRDSDKGPRSNKSKKTGSAPSKGRGDHKPKSAGLAKRKRTPKGEPLPKFSDKVRLNKFLANAGICSRREADTLISSGVVSVNGEIVTELGYKVASSDNVKYDGISINPVKKRYVLLNKPKGFSIMSTGKDGAVNLVKNACKENIFPIGKLEKSASGLILYTNDTDMEKKLTHPKFKVSQLFHITLDKILQPEDLAQLTAGLYVDDRMFSAEEASFIDGKSHREVGVSILSSKSNTVKLMFGKMGYEVVNLDRVEFAGLTKKDLPRGNYRHLEEKEVGFLKMS
jgi:23S rRNA pseudouridine2605 synthase